MKTYKNQWVVVNYWASWCKPCITEMPVLEQFYQQHKDQVVVIGANIEYEDGLISEENIVNFTKKLNVSFPIVKANIKNNVTSLGKIKALPTTIFINPEGKINFTKIGIISKKLLDERIQVAH